MLAVAEREQLPVPQARAGSPEAWDILFQQCHWLFEDCLAGPNFRNPDQRSRAHQLIPDSAAQSVSRKRRARSSIRDLGRSAANAVFLLCGIDFSRCIPTNSEGCARSWSDSGVAILKSRRSDVDLHAIPFANFGVATSNGTPLGTGRIGAGGTDRSNTDFDQTFYF